ncbi:MAG: tail fiber domain-containing protein, partial [Patescibacteria group bacterium]
ASDTGVVGQIATSSLGLLTTNVAEGSGLYWTIDRFDTRLSATTTLPNLQILLGLTNVTSTGITATNLNVTTVKAGLWNGTAIGPTYGGTGLTSYVIGDILYASAANTLAALVTSTAGSVLQLSFSTGLPSYATTSSLKIALTDTTGTLAVNRGGTNLTSYTKNELLYASDTGVVGQIATSSLGLLTTNVAEGTGLYWTIDRFDTRLSATTTLPNLTTLTGLVSVTTTLIQANGLANFTAGLIAGSTSSTISGMAVTSTIGTGIVTLLPPSSYLRIGDAGFTSQVLAANDDLFVSGKLEVDGAVYFDGTVTFSSTFSAGAAQIRANTYLSFGTSGAESGFYDGTTAGQLNLFLGTGNGRQLVFGDYAVRSQDYGHATQPDPTLYIHSVTGPATDNQEFIGISVSSTLNQAIIQTGSSIDIAFSPAASSTVLMLLSTAGKLGIGTTVPSSTLHIVTSTEQLRLGNDTNTKYLSLTHNGTEGVLDTGDNSGLRLSMYDVASVTNTVASSTYMRFEASGWNTAGGGSLNNVSTTIQLVPISAGVTGANISSYLLFTDTGTQYARFGKAGGNTTAPYLAGEAADGTGVIGVVLGGVNISTASGSTSRLVSFKKTIGTGGGTEVASVNATGTIWASGGVVIGTEFASSTIDDAANGNVAGVLYIGQNIISTVAPSDERVKRDITSTALSILDLMKINVVDFRFKPEFTLNSEELQHGVIAQQVEGIYPYVVSMRTDGYKSVDYQRFIPLLMKSVQDQQTQIQALSLNNLQGNLNGNINQDALAVIDMNFQGKLKVKGQVAFGQDTVGQVKILAGATEAQVNFSAPYEYQPIVTLTLASDNYLTKYYVSSASSTGFIIKIEPQQTEKDALFNWHAFGSEIPLTVIDEPVVVPEPQPSSGGSSTPPAETPPTTEPVILPTETPLPQPEAGQPMAEVVETPTPVIETPAPPVVSEVELPAPPQPEAGQPLVEVPEAPVVEVLPPQPEAGQPLAEAAETPPAPPVTE